MLSDGDWKDSMFTARLCSPPAITDEMRSDQDVTWRRRSEDGGCRWDEACNWGRDLEWYSHWYQSLPPATARAAAASASSFTSEMGASHHLHDQ